jgi:ABC-type polysaccharide/polyol phosphate transport system ATPase subunit
MAFVSIRGVSVDFPIYKGGSRSLRKLLLAMTSRRNIAKDAQERVHVRALTDINLDIRDGDRLALLGANGAGKSTLLKVLGKIYHPSRGRVLSCGRVSGLLTASVGLNGDATGRENIILLGMYMDVPPRHMARRIDEIAEFTELGFYLDMPVRTYSSGMVFRLCFAVATSVQPEILLLDEWIGTGDAAFLARARNRMANLISKTSIVVLASHSLPILEEWCNRAILLNRGRIAAAGTVKEVADAYAILLDATLRGRVTPAIEPETREPEDRGTVGAARRPVLVGSPPGAGSTLLSVILDAHPEIACGPELGLFAHPLLFTDFTLFKHAVAWDEHQPSPSRDSYRALALGLAPYSGVSDFNARYYGLDSDGLLARLPEFDSAAAFTDAIFTPWLAARGKHVFAEKSPENIYGMRAFLDAFPAGLAICLVRNPLDQILSLKRRSFSFGRALSIWLVESALCLHLAQTSRVHLMRYEDLVGEPASALGTLCDFLGVARIDDLPDTYRDRSSRITDDPTIAIPSWSLHPGDGIQTSAIGRGAIELTAEEIAAVHGAFISDPPSQLKPIAGLSLLEVAARLGYTLPRCPSPPIEDFLIFLDREMLTSCDSIRRPSWFQERMTISSRLVFVDNT